MRKVNVFKDYNKEQFDYIGVFHQFATESEEFETNAGNYPVGLVEKSDGTIQPVHVSCIQFREPIHMGFDDSASREYSPEGRNKLALEVLTKLETEDGRWTRRAILVVRSILRGETFMVQRDEQTQPFLHYVRHNLGEYHPVWKYIAVQSKRYMDNVVEEICEIEDEKVFKELQELATLRRQTLEALRSLAPDRKRPEEFLAGLIDAVKNDKVYRPPHNAMTFYKSIEICLGKNSLALAHIHTDYGTEVPDEPPR